MGREHALIRGIKKTCVDFVRYRCCTPKSFLLGIKKLVLYGLVLYFDAGR